MKYLIWVFLILTSCSINKDMVTIKYKSENHFRYSLKIPKNYKIEKYEVTTEKEVHYIYDDSSYIYITNFKYVPNYENIRTLGDSIFQYRFQNEELINEIGDLLKKRFLTLPRFFELSGMNNDSLFWKDIKIDEVSVGYYNVSKEKMEMFDKALKTIKVK